MFRSLHPQIPPDLEARLGGDGNEAQHIWEELEKVYAARFYPTYLGLPTATTKGGQHRGKRDLSIRRQSHICECVKGPSPAYASTISHHQGGAG